MVAEKERGVDHSEMASYLQWLCPPLGAPGREEEIRSVLKRWLEPRVQRLRVDPLGNLQAWIGRPELGTVMLDAHMDEAAFLVQLIDEKGFARVAPMGRIDPRIMPGSRILLQPEPDTRVEGLIGFAPPHLALSSDATTAVTWENLYVDMGFSSREEAITAGIEVGTPAVLDLGMGFIGNNCFWARNLDNRAGCALLCAVIEKLSKNPPPFELVFNFSAAEEVGLRGATVGAYSIAPDLALILDTTAGDTPGIEEARYFSVLGRGPAVTLADNRIVVQRRLVDSLEQASRKAGVPWQRKLPLVGGTNAGAIHLSRGGVPTCVLSLPTRYIHTPVSILNLEDLQGMLEIVLNWLIAARDLL